MAKLLLIAGIATTMVSVPYSRSNASIVLTRAANGKVYLPVRKFLESVDLPVNKQVQRLYSLDATHRLREGLANVSGATIGSARPVMCMDVEALQVWAKDFLLKENLSPADRKTVSSLANHSQKLIAAMAPAKSAVASLAQVELPLESSEKVEATVAPKEVVKPGIEKISLKKLLKDIRAAMKKLKIVRYESTRTHKALVTMSARLPYWNLRDAANVLRVHESDLADALIEDGLLVREDHKLRPANSSLATSFFIETTASNNVRIKPDQKQYLEGVAERHSIPTRKGS